MFITDNVENIVPEFLTLLHGVIDSPDIPLNVSRSYLQADGNVKKISSHIEKIRAEGRNHALIVVAEAVKKEDGSKATVRFIDGQVRLGGIGSYLADQIYKNTGAETRVTVLGHLQRGAPPTHRDRLIASAFGVYAVDLIAKGRFNRIVVWQNRGVTDINLDSIAGYSQTIDREDPLIKVAKGLGIYVGEIT